MANFELKIIGTYAECLAAMNAVNGGLSATSLSGAATPNMLSGNEASHSEPDETGPVNTNAPAVDSVGLPWDARIHSTNKAQTADGTWRKRRGADAATIASVEAELKLRGSQGAGMFMNPNAAQQQPQFTGATAQVQMPQGQPMGQPQGMPQGMPQGQPMGMPQGQPQYQMQPQMQPQFQQQPIGPMDFNQFMAHLSTQMAKRDPAGNMLITAEYLATVCQRLSMQFQRPFNAITDVAADINLIGAAAAIITADGRWS